MEMERWVWNTTVWVWNTTVWVWNTTVWVWNTTVWVWNTQMIWEKADDETKKNVRLRLLDEQIMHKEDCIRQLQHKVETMKMIRVWMEKV